ncbi:MAG: AAA family ATPase, partial [bacterium]
MIQKNPYIAGPPIEDEKQFFGRKELIRKLMQGIRSSSQNAFFLHGPRSIGKTSLLKQLEYNLCDEGYTQVYFDLNGKSRLYLTELLYEIAQAIADACAFQPPRQENFDQDGRYFLQVFLPQIEKASPKSNVVLLFDAFDSNAMARAGQAAKVFLPFLLNHLRSFQKVKILYCLNSDCEHLLLKSKNSAFFQIPRLSKSETATLVRQSEAGGTLLWEKAAIEHVWNLTHGHPFLAQVICNFTWAAARNAKNGNIPTTTPDDVEAACEAALPKIKKLFQQVLQKLHPPEQAMFGTIVKYCSGNFDGQ